MKGNYIKLLLLIWFVSCKKQDVTTPTTGNYYVRIAAVESTGEVSYSQIARVKAGRVVIDYSAEPALRFDVQTSTDGEHFTTYKSSAKNILKDTIYLK